MATERERGEHTTIPIYPINDLTLEQIAGICDHTFLNRPEAYRSAAKAGESPVRLRETAFRKFLNGVVEHTELIPYALCVRPEDVNVTARFLEANRLSRVKVASVVGFPNSESYTQAHIEYETKEALDRGAREVDMVLKYDTLKAAESSMALLSELVDIVDIAHGRRALVKLILETSELSPEQVITACELATVAQVDFVKTSTGFSSAGATPEQLKVMSGYFHGGIKISGGVTTANVHQLLGIAARRTDGYIALDPSKVRIGESSLLYK